jgi:trehalose synthase
MTYERTIPNQLHHVNFGHKPLSDYRSTLVPGMYDQIQALAARLEGTKVLHLSATAFGGGVAEIMYSLMPLMQDVGLQPTWGIVHGLEEFYDVTKLLHNSLQGAPQTLSAEQRETYWRYQEINAGLFDPDEYDVIVVHDPQPLGLLKHFPGSRARWAWRCHIDLSAPNADTLDFLLPEIERYPVAMFHRREYVPPGYDGSCHIVPPAIDPLAPKNMALSAYDARYIVGQFGIDTDRPLMCQVSRFDPWKDPLGVIDAYRLVKAEFPELQLALVGSMAHDDPEGWDFFNRTVEHAREDPDIFVLSNFNNVGAVEVNAFQVHADVVMQKSLREGFGLTVSEALWKARPVVAGNVGGIRTQVQDGETGHLVASVEEAARATAEVLRDPARAAEMARSGKEFVRQHFLTPRYLHDHMELYTSLLGA